MSKYILFEWIVPIGFALLSAGLVVFIIEINEWFGRKEDKRQERLKNEKRQPAKENKKEGGNVKGTIRGRCPKCGGKIIYSEFYQNARDYTIRKDGKVPNRYVSRSGELSESVAACENGCGAYWEDEDFSIGQDGMFYDNKYTEDGQT